MSSMHSTEVKANIERAEQAVSAAQKLLLDGYYDFAASRAYYAVFYAASALLLQEGLEFRKHSGRNSRYPPTVHKNWKDGKRVWKKYKLAF